MSLVLALALYAAAASFIGGTAWRVWTWAATPEPFQIPTTSAQQRSLSGIAPSRVESPSTTLGVIGRMFLEGFLFRSLFRNTAPGRTPAGADVCPDPIFLERKALWLGAMAFHWSLLVIVVRHLRLFVEPVPRIAGVLASVDGFFQIGSPTWYATDATVVVALGYLLLRRLRDPLLRYISLPADYLAVGTLLAVAGTGIAVRYIARTDLVAVRHFTLSLAALAPSAAPPLDTWLVLHLLSVSFLLAILPFTKMIHAAGMWLSPTRNQRNDSRRRRHVNPWNAPAPIHSYEEWEDEFRDKLLAAGMPVERNALRVEGPGSDGAAEA
ncbi:MAG TPA: sulfate reduction electron transfer complex DsrMKJOP subunit DsrM [Vicinamibacterales bacterium]